MSADNQQERLSAKWIVGFTDGEGCFHVAINKLPKMTLGWQVLPEFRIVQHQRDDEVLYRIKKFFNFGKITKNHGDRNEFRVRGLENLKKIILFFEEYPFMTDSKKKNFEVFSQIIHLMDNKEHLEKEGLYKIANLICQMNTMIVPRILRDYMPNQE